MTVQEKIQKQEELLDNIPAEEASKIFICQDCGDFIYLQPLQDVFECKGCGSCYRNGDKV